MRGGREHKVDRERWLVSYSDLLVLLLAVFVVLYATSKVEGSRRAEREPVAGDVGDAQRTGIVLEEELRGLLPDAVRSGRVRLHTERDGAVVLSIGEVGAFRSGEAELSPAAAENVRRIADALRARGLQVRVEGHTDALPLRPGKYRSNWDLSAARAMAVAEVLLRPGGLEPAAVSIAGYAGYHPVATNDTEEGRMQNRRVDLVLKRQSTL